MAASNGVDKLYKLGVRYAKAGVMLLDISCQTCKPRLHCSTKLKALSSQHLMKTIDAINQSEVQQTYTYFSLPKVIYKTWAMQRNRMTQAFTTKWGEIPVVD